MKNNRTLAVMAAFTGKKLISKKIYNQEKTRAFLEVKNGNEIWVRGQHQDWHWIDGPEFQLTTLSEDVKNTFFNENHFTTSKSHTLRQAIKMAWHEAAKQNDFFNGADSCLENHVLAKRVYNNGQNAAFLEMRNGSEFWIYGKFYDSRWFFGPEVKIELNLTETLKEEFLLHDAWSVPLSATAKQLIKQAWKQAAEKHPFFEKLIA